MMARGAMLVNDWRNVFIERRLTGNSGNPHPRDYRELPHSHHLLQAIVCNFERPRLDGDNMVDMEQYNFACGLIRDNASLLAG
jgi:hypothetical protein